MGCCAIVIYFRSSSAMEAAYGLAITLCMLATSILFPIIWYPKGTFPAHLSVPGRVPLHRDRIPDSQPGKFPHGGYVTLVVGGALFTVMYVWYRARKIKNRYVEFVRIEEYISKLEELSNDTSVPKYATHLVYLTSANNPKEIEHKIIYSILRGKPKRADIYWFVHVDTLDDPYTCEYKVEHIIPNDIIRVEFRLSSGLHPHKT